MFVFFIAFAKNSLYLPIKNIGFMARQHKDSRHELDISPFRIYVKLRPETEHLDGFFSSLNDDPVFTRGGLFHVVTLPSDICANVRKTYHPLYDELVNVAGDKNFNERDVIYRSYELRDLLFESVNFPDPSDLEGIRKTMFNITEEQEEEVRNGIVRMLKASAGNKPSQRNNPHLVMQSIQETLREALADSADTEPDGKIAELSDYVSSCVRMSRCVDAIEETLGKEIWLRIDETLRYQGDPETSDRAMFSFFRTGGIAFPPKVRLVRTPEEIRTKTHSRYIISVQSRGMMQPRYVSFEHSDSFAIYTWLLLNPGTLFSAGEAGNNNSILSVIQALNGRSYVSNSNIYSTLTKPLTSINGTPSYQRLQQAMTNANRDIIDAFMPLKQKGRPAKDAEKPDRQQKAAREEQAKKKASVLLVDSCTGRDSRRFIPLASEYIEICDEFRKDFHDTYLDGKPDWNFIRIYMPQEIGGDRYLLYTQLCSYAKGETEDPEDRNAAAVYDFDDTRISEAIGRYEEKLCSVSSDVCLAASRVKNGREGEEDWELIRRYISPEMSSREDLMKYVTGKENGLSSMERLVYQVSCGKCVTNKG